MNEKNNQIRFSDEEKIALRLILRLRIDQCQERIATVQCAEQREYWIQQKAEAAVLDNRLRNL